jgi:phage tail protein X
MRHFGISLIITILSGLPQLAIAVGADPINYYVVRPGDTISGILYRANLGPLYAHGGMIDQIINANQGIIANIDALKIGQKIYFPAELVAEASRTGLLINLPNSEIAFAYSQPDSNPTNSIARSVSEATPNFHSGPCLIFREPAATAPLAPSVPAAPQVPQVAQVATPSVSAAAPTSAPATDSISALAPERVPATATATVVAVAPPVTAPAPVVPLAVALEPTPVPTPLFNAAPIMAPAPAPIASSSAAPVTAPQATPEPKRPSGPEEQSRFSISIGSGYARIDSHMNETNTNAVFLSRPMALVRAKWEQLWSSEVTTYLNWGFASEPYQDASRGVLYKEQQRVSDFGIGTVFPVLNWFLGSVETGVREEVFATSYEQGSATLESRPITFLKVSLTKEIAHQRGLRLVGTLGGSYLMGATATGYDVLPGSEFFIRGRLSHKLKGFTMFADGEYSEISQSTSISNQRHREVRSNFGLIFPLYTEEGE